VALAAGVRELCDLDAAARLEMGRRGRDYFQANFGSDMLLGRLENWCSELASTRGTASVMPRSSGASPRVLVTGAAGFIGQHLRRVLAERGI